MNIPEHQAGGQNTRRGWSDRRVLVMFAMGYKWFYNGANSVAFKIGGGTVHPLLVASMRFAIAAVMILPFDLWRLYRRPANRAELANAAALGVTMLVGSQSSASARSLFISAGSIEASHSRS